MSSMGFREHDRRNPKAKRSTKFVRSWVALRIHMFGSQDIEEELILIADYSYWHSVTNTMTTIVQTRYALFITSASKIDIEVWYYIYIKALFLLNWSGRLVSNHCYGFYLFCPFANQWNLEWMEWIDDQIWKCKGRFLLFADSFTDSYLPSLAG